MPEIEQSPYICTLFPIPITLSISQFFHVRLPHNKAITSPTAPNTTPEPSHATLPAAPVELAFALDPVAVAVAVALELPASVPPVTTLPAPPPTGPVGTDTDALYPDGTLSLLVVAPTTLPLLSVLCSVIEKSVAVAEGGSGSEMRVGVSVAVPALLRIADMAEEGGLLVGTLETGWADSWERVDTWLGFWRFSDSAARVRGMRRRDVRSLESILKVGSCEVMRRGRMERGKGDICGSEGIRGWIRPNRHAEQYRREDEQSKGKGRLEVERRGQAGPRKLKGPSPWVGTRSSPTRIWAARNRLVVRYRPKQAGGYVNASRLAVVQPVQRIGRCRSKAVAFGEIGFPFRGRGETRRDRGSEPLSRVPGFCGEGVQASSDRHTEHTICSHLRALEFDISGL
jgi:hypothetical protein